VRISYEANEVLGGENPITDEGLRKAVFLEREGSKI
jgi:hypothetical protein